jgi:hypothetical protein
MQVSAYTKQEVGPEQEAVTGRLAWKENIKEEGPECLGPPESLQGPQLSYGQEGTTLEDFSQGKIELGLGFIHSSHLDVVLTIKNLKLNIKFRILKTTVDRIWGKRPRVKSWGIKEQMSVFNNLCPNPNHTNEHWPLSIHLKLLLYW